MKKCIKKLALLVTVLALVMAAAACSKKEEEAGNDDSIVVGITQDLDSLDPHVCVAAGTKEVLYNVFEGLVKADTEGNLVPAVAKSYEISPDGKKYTFKLRDGVKFHNGSTVTAEDVKYSIERVSGLTPDADNEIKIEKALSVIDKVVIEDEETIVLELNESDTELLGYLTAAIIPKDYKDQGKNPVGTGPFKFESYTPLESFVVVKNDDYWGDKAYLSKVTFKIASDGDALFLELTSGNVDIIPYLTDAQASSIPKGYRLETGTMNMVQGLYFNCAKAPFNDPKVRQAVCLCLDKQEILDMVAGGRGEITGSNVSPRFAKYFSEEARDYYKKDINKAKELLKEAGAEKLEFTITVPSNYVFHVDTAQVIEQQLKAAGITAEINQVDWAAWLDDVYKGGKYEATVIGLACDLAPSDTVSRFDSNAGNNFVKYSNPEFDELFAKAKSTTDENEKVKLYKEIQMLMAKDATAAFIQDPALLMAVNDKLTGIRFYPVQVLDMSGIKFKEEE